MTLRQAIVCYPMKIPSGNFDLRDLKGNARYLVSETRILADGHIQNLKGQVEELWRSAEELMPTDPAADLMEHVERTLEDLRGWRAIGLIGQFAT